MCGILGIISEKKDISLLEAVERLKRLEYRGYDSAGLVIREGLVIKKAGEIEKIKKIIEEKFSDVKTNLIICHSRWASHGEVSDINAHPHFDCDKKIFVVHNGTIDNYEEIKEELRKKGHKFYSETDSELIAHFFEEKIKESKDLKEVVLEFFEKFKGTYAAIIYFKDLNKVLVIKNGSPLVIGLDEKNKRIYISSDIYAFIDKTNKVITLDDYNWAIFDLK